MSEASDLAWTGISGSPHHSGDVIDNPIDMTSDSPAHHDLYLRRDILSKKTAFLATSTRDNTNLVIRIICFVYWVDVTCENLFFEKEEVGEWKKFHDAIAKKLENTYLENDQWTLQERPIDHDTIYDMNLIFILSHDVMFCVQGVN
jgi:hypothetical protein